MYPDKFHLTKEQNRCFAKKNLVRLVFTNSRFEGVNTILPQRKRLLMALVRLVYLLII